MTGEQEALVLDNLRLAHHFANRYSRVLGDEDAFSDACVGLVQAALAFDPIKGKFSSFAALRINGALVDEMRRRPGGRNRHARGDAPVFCSLDEFPAEWGEDPALVDNDPLPDEQAEANDTKGYIKTCVRAAIARLAERDARIVTEYYIKGMRLADIGRRLGIGEPRVSQLNARALGILRQRLEREVSCA